MTIIETIIVIHICLLLKNVPYPYALTHCVLVDSSLLYAGRVHLSCKGCQAYFVAFTLFLMENPVSKPYPYLWPVSQLLLLIKKTTTTLI